MKKLLFLILILFIACGPKGQKGNKDACDTYNLNLQSNEWSDPIWNDKHIIVNGDLKIIVIYDDCNGRRTIYRETTNLDENFNVNRIVFSHISGTSVYNLWNDAVMFVDYDTEEIYLKISDQRLNLYQEKYEV